MDRCKQQEPKVIDSVMIEKCIHEQAPPGEAGRLAILEGIPLDEVVQIRLEFLQIVRIDHLWVLPMLVKLSLSNNLIEEIENLDSLIHLNELDLSFNKIKKIKNLKKLLKLEILTLFDNNISVLENMDELKKLLIFSVGNNCIEDRDNVLYLRRFRKLQSVNMAGNPCAKQEDFLLFIAAMLPQISYYQYRLVPVEDRTIGLELFMDQLKEVNKVEEKVKAIEDKIEANLAEAELHSGSFVEFLGSNQLFAQMFEDDVEGKAFLLINEDCKNFYAEYEEKFVKITKQIFEVGQTQYKIRRVEVDQFFESINTSKKHNQSLSIEKMEIFLTKKVETFSFIKKLEKQMEEETISVEEFNEKVQKCADEYNDVIHNIWKDLMSIELTLYEQMEEVVITFEQVATEQINVFIEAAQGFFTELRDLEQTYMESISNEALAFQTLSTLQEDFPVPEELEVIMSDKEVLTNALGATHDMHMLVIDTREDTLVNRAKTWLNNLVGGLTKEEMERNRGKVLEINHFLDVQREEFDDLHAFAVGNTMMIDPDVSAALN